MKMREGYAHGKFFGIYEIMLIYSNRMTWSGG
jgi:hypothetical protein